MFECNEVYNKQTGNFEIVDVECPNDWIAYDEIDQQSIVAMPCNVRKNDLIWNGNVITADEIMKSNQEFAMLGGDY